MQSVKECAPRIVHIYTHHLNVPFLEQNLNVMVKYTLKHIACTQILDVGVRNYQNCSFRLNIKI